MDVKSFSDESFDPVVWINKSLHQATGEANQETHGLAFRLQQQLQLLLQEINQSLEETAHQVIRSLPFVLKQAESLEEELQEVRREISAMKADVGSRSDAVQRMQVTHDTLERLRSCLESSKRREGKAGAVVQESDDQLEESDTSKDL